MAGDVTMDQKSNPGDTKQDKLPRHVNKRCLKLACPKICWSAKLKDYSSRTLELPEVLSKDRAPC